MPPVDEKMLKTNRIVSFRNYRNRRIGDFLKGLELTEGRGTGFPIIYDAMERNGSPKPIFETDQDRTFFATTLPIHERYTENEEVSEMPTSQKVAKKTISKTTFKTVSKTVPKTVSKTISKTVPKTVEILKQIKKNPQITYKDLSEVLGVSERGVKYHFQKMSKSGVIKREGSNRHGKWVIL